MRMKETYQEKMDARLEKLAEQIYALRDRAFDRQSAFNAEQRRRLEGLRDTYKKAQVQLRAIEQAGEDDWEHLRPEMERLLDGIDQKLAETEEPGPAQAGTR